MKRLFCLAIVLIFVSVLSMPVVSAGSGTTSKSQTETPKPAPKILYTASKSEIDATNKDKGYLVIRYLKETNKKLKIRVIKLKSDGTEQSNYVYDLNSKGKQETFSLTDGSGKYQIKVLENIEGNSYAVQQNQTIDVKIANAFDPFLIPIQYVNYTNSSKAVVKARELTKNCKNDLQKVQEIYKFILNNIVYDYNKANKVVNGELNGYVPVVDVILNNKKGICFDYSSLMAAMLRSVGIPTKLIMGYVAPNNAYHAWNDVYIKGTGWIKINSQVYFDGKKYSRMDSTFAAANKSGKQTAFIGNGKNYAPLYQY